ncbi:hypothetical protein, partial [Phormidium sp. CCY1219]|uniref:hypothetical protein n=1 Tax=Phormidium sp. CCY1219 TaxID=2886104 RepID=UPI002D1F3F33
GGPGVSRSAYIPTDKSGGFTPILGKDFPGLTSGSAVGSPVEGISALLRIHRPPRLSIAPGGIIPWAIALCIGERSRHRFHEFSHYHQCK